jgi:hypothetical protein
MSQTGATRLIAIECRRVAAQSQSVRSGGLRRASLDFHAPEFA